MKMQMLKLTALCTLVAAMAFAPAQGFAQDNKDAAPKTEAKDARKEGKKKGGLPTPGKLDAIDKIAKTIKVGERTFQITSETKLTKAGKPATLDDAVVGDEVGISYKAVDGKLVANSVRFGPRPEGAGGEKKKKKKE